MRELTSEQSAALEAFSKHRMTVIRAGPGSGKTHVFVEALSRTIKGWNLARRGIAALSFTNVAHEEITKRLGGAPAAPHFVGTLDAFLLRFVVQPFASSLGVRATGCRLIPAPVAAHIRKPEVLYGEKQWQRQPVVSFTFRGGDETSPHIGVKESNGWVSVQDAAARRVMEAKRKDWQAHGRVTHSDCHYLASALLRGPQGKHIAKLVTARFPVMLVDEFQDTGWFLGRALLELLREVGRGLVVGDPDQAIYQFSGADRGLFDECEAIADGKFAITPSHRCAQRIAEVASVLARSGKTIVSHTGTRGKACLLVYGDTTMSHEKAVALLRPHMTQEEAMDLLILARRAAEPERQRSGPWSSGAHAARICNAIDHLRREESRLALQVISSEMGRLLLDKEHVTHDELVAMALDPIVWKRAAASFLFSVQRDVQGQTWNDWIGVVKEEAEARAKELGLTPSNLGAKLKKTTQGGNGLRELGSGKSNVEDAVEMTTVHGAKGREAAAVILLVAKPHMKQSPCPSTTWWSDDISMEEREIAYVACSRAKTFLCLAIHKETYERLKTTQSAFVGLFEVLEQ